MSTDELIDEFVRLAQGLSSLWTFWFKTPTKTPERGEMKQELKAIGAELCARKPIEELRQLFDHENVDVRFHSVWAFMAVDPDWALATISAHREDLATRDVIALRARQEATAGAPDPEGDVDGSIGRPVRGRGGARIRDAISRRRV
jgi:hypothetical protein